MANDPIRERILQHCLDSLAAINGGFPYRSELAVPSRRGHPTAATLATLPAAFLWGGEEDLARVPNAKLSRTFTLHVEAWLRSTADELPMLAEYLLADVERALTDDPTRGGLATATTMTHNDILTDEDPGVLARILADFLITYRTTFGSPEQAG
jgi:hypothetical protein